jgi:hypothetical protein
VAGARKRKGRPTTERPSPNPRPAHKATGHLLRRSRVYGIDLTAGRLPNLALRRARSAVPAREELFHLGSQFLREDHADLPDGRRAIKGYGEFPAGFVEPAVAVPAKNRHVFE